MARAILIWSLVVASSWGVAAGASSQAQVTWAVEQITLRHLLSHSAGFRGGTWPWGTGDAGQPYIDKEILRPLGMARTFLDRAPSYLRADRTR